MKNEYVLGINIGLHDSSAAIVKDGLLIAMSDQERFSRNKSAINESPIDAIKFCLEKAKISIDDLDAIALGTDVELLNKWLCLSEEEMKSRIKLDDIDRLFPKDKFKYKKLPKIVYVNHHLAHAASAFRASGFDDAAILVVDNRGEDVSTSLAFGKGKEICFLKQYGVSHSLGLYYRVAAQYAGLCGKYREVGKFMGLASYGVPNQKVPLIYDNGPKFTDDDFSELRGLEIPPKCTEQLMTYFKENCFPYTAENYDEVMSYANFAASVQKSLEDILLALCKDLKEMTGVSNLVIAGGVALNCSANGVISESNIFKNIFIQPAAGDAGTALGAALEVAGMLSPSNYNKFVMNHAYWGEEYTQEQINVALDKAGLVYEVLAEDALLSKVADLLCEYYIIGWFQGRYEIGPRALGARSLIANPTKRDTLVRLNKIKNREMWRPIAPSVLEDKFSDYFTGKHKSPFMLVASMVKKNVQKLIPAVVHIDGSARPQVVNRETNTLYYDLICEFEKRSGIPILANTSFNLQRKLRYRCIGTW